MQQFTLRRHKDIQVWMPTTNQEFETDSKKERKKDYKIETSRNFCVMHKKNNNQHMK